MSASIFNKDVRATYSAFVQTNGTTRRDRMRLRKDLAVAHVQANVAVAGLSAKAEVQAVQDRVAEISPTTKEMVKGAAIGAAIGTAVGATVGVVNHLVAQAIQEAEQAAQQQGGAQ